jgi:hypothetical protein
MKLISYTLTALAGLCFASGMIIWSNKGDNHNGAIRNTSSITR